MRAAIMGVLVGAAVLALGGLSFAGVRVPCPCTPMDGCHCPLRPPTPKERSAPTPARQAAYVDHLRTVRLASQDRHRRTKVGQREAASERHLAPVHRAEPAVQHRKTVPVERTKPGRPVLVQRAAPAAHRMARQREAARERTNRIAQGEPQTGYRQHGWHGHTGGGALAKREAYRSFRKQAARERDTEELASGGAESGAGVERDGAGEPHRYYRHEHRDWADYDGEDYRSENEGESGLPEATPRKIHSPRTLMSVNDPAALSPWRGYGVDCPHSPE